MIRLAMASMAIFAWLIFSAKAEEGKVVYNKICYFFHDVGLIGHLKSAIPKNGLDGAIKVSKSSIKIR